LHIWSINQNISKFRGIYIATITRINRIRMQ